MEILIGILSAGFFQVSKEMEKKVNEKREYEKDNDECNAEDSFMFK